MSTLISKHPDVLGKYFAGGKFNYCIQVKHAVTLTPKTWDPPSGNPYSYINYVSAKYSEWQFSTAEDLEAFCSTALSKPEPEPAPTSAPSCQLPLQGEHKEDVQESC
jgi:hypothetical protein